MDIRRRNKNKLLKLDNRQGWLAVCIPLLLIMIFDGYPMVKGIYESFTNWDGLFQNDFVGLKNYIQILTNNEFWKMLSNNFILLLFIPAQILLGLIVAVLLYEEIPGWKFYRSCYYLPQVTSALSIGYIFSVLFGMHGPINTLLQKIGMGFLAVNWLGSRGTALTVIILCLIWMNIGWQAMLFLGGMSTIPTEVYESAKLDGAGYWTRMFKITLPLLVHTLEYSCVMSVLWCFTGLFSIIASITNGGPGYDTTTVDYMIYLKAFRGTSKYGYACALAVILAIIVVFFTVMQMKTADKSDDWSN
ncbi:MAG: sugar ABC transporter permease [Eubacteriales bacterium]|nr:sugar ABC transporter permease [Eubacteriales bacterium]